MVRGMSYQKGILFMGKEYLAICYNNNNGNRYTSLQKITIPTLLKVGKLAYFSMPLWYHLALISIIMLIIVPRIIYDLSHISWEGLPLFTLIFFLIGTHLWFPKELRKYHGAEHKVFSYRGIISIRNKNKIKEAEITNRHCSTNSIFLFFVIVVMLLPFILLVGQTKLMEAIDIAAVTAVIFFPLYSYWVNGKKSTYVKKIILSGSYWLQRYVTTAEPDDHHIITAIRAYRKLALKEFPNKVLTLNKKKERNKMAIADVTVIPIGTNTTSVSTVVAEIHRVLESTEKTIKYELTPMSTIIEGELPILLDIIKEIHEVPFKLGINRVATNIRIDDRRDKIVSMEDKKKSVQARLEK